MLGDNLRAVALLRELQRRDPGDFWITRDLALFLARSEAAPYHESLRFRTAAVAIRPGSHMTHAELAAILDRRGQRREAIAEYREALRLKPDSGMVRDLLGRSLLKAGRRDEAVAQLREALPLVRREEWVGSNSRIGPQEVLGRALLETGDVAGLVAAFRQAVENDPKDPSVRHRLAAALLLSGDRAGYRRVAARTAEDFRESADPFIAEAARACLLAPGPPAEAAIALRMARDGLGRQPGLPWWLYVLGLAHLRAGQDEAAIARSEESIRQADPGWNALAMNWPVLAMAHHRLGHRAESRRWLEMAHGRQGDPARGLEPGRDPLAGERWWDRADFRILVREADALFPPEDRPRDSFERAEEAATWYNRRHFAAAAWAFSEALDSDLLLATSRAAGIRYQAACAAALAGAGRGEAPLTDEKERPRWRKQAVAWLKADLTHWGKQVEGAKAEAKGIIVQALRHWKDDADLAGLRDEAAVKALPEDEQKACQALWTEVDALLRKAQGP
jgi:tetratricopeptide (TPR) repeat protein